MQLDPRYEDRLIAAQARALAAAGSIAAAKARLEATIRDFEAVGPNGVPIAALYETVAEIALLETDTSTFQRALEEVKRIYSRGKHPGLVARYERLVATGRRQLSQWSGSGLVRNDVHERMLTVTQVRSGIGPARSDEQFRQLLGIVLDEAAAASGYLYQLSSVTRCGSSHSAEPRRSIQRSS
ncbi:MAG TPA: hypothetical protein VFG30_18385 [Polyangiales bacterium]|nr:hypothetical protein [Polyangiales bacterium]